MIMNSFIAFIPLLFSANLILFSPQFMATASEISSKSPSVISVLAVVPTTGEQNNDKYVHQWKRGEEILSGALLALKEINEMSTFLNGSQLDIIPVRVPLCDLNQGIIPFVKELTTNRNNLLAAVGYFCQNIAQVYSQLIRHEELRLVQISANPLHHQSEMDCTSCRQHSILPSYVSSVKAAILFFHELDWNQVALISNNDINLKTSKENFLTFAIENSINVPLQMEVSHVTNDITVQFLQELLRTGIKIVIVYVSPSEAVEIICRAHHHGFKWPDYAWILMRTNISEITQGSDHDLCPHSHFSVTLALNNALFLYPQLETSELQTFPSGLNYSVYHSAYLKQLEQTSLNQNRSLQSNPYANVLYDSIWAIAIALNRSLSILEDNNFLFTNNGNEQRRKILALMDDCLKDLSFQGATGFLNFSQKTASRVNSVTLLQFQGGHLETVGVYDSNIDHFFLNVNTYDFPSVTLDRIYILYPVVLTVILTIVIMLCFILTTVSMCLFFHYRKHPAIKATSSTLSICMFIGCYFLLTSSMFHTISSGISKHQSPEPIRAFICSFDVYLINIGFDTVFATVIAKTLRIYHIFKTFGKVGRICSDKGLLILILTIVCIKIVMLTIWTFSDINHLVDAEQYVVDSIPPYYLVSQQCQSKYLNAWIALLFGYSMVILFILVVLAFMTRKIKRQHFNESKKISTLSGVLLLHICISWTLWILFRSINASVLSKVVYSLNTMLTAFFLQAYLVIPKIVPLVLHRKHRRELISRVSQFSMVYRQFSRAQIETEDTVL